MGGDLTWDQYEEISQLPNVTANSCHYNANTNNPNTCLEALNHRSGTSFFYVGEAGYQGEGNCSGGACTNSNCTNCCDLPVLQKRADQVKNDLNTLISAGANAFLIWQFSPKGSSTLICDSFSVFPKDPICNGTGDLPYLLEPIVISDASYVCSDKDVTHKESWTEIVSPTPSSSPQFTIDQNSDANNKRVLGESSPDVSTKLEGGDLSGEVTISSSKISEFEPLQEKVSDALTKLLPQELSQNVVLPGTVTMNFYHRILGQDESGNFTKISTCENTPSGYWGKLAGSIRGLYGFLYPPNPDAPVSKFQFQIAPAENSCQDDCPNCSPGGVNTQEKNLTAIKNTKPDFSLSAFIKKIITRIKETTEGVLTFLGLKHEETKEIRVLSRSSLPGGKETAENAKLFNIFMPAEIIETITPKNETKALTANYQYNISFSDSTTEDTPTFYYDLEKLRNSSCIGLCSQLPSGVNIKDINPICPSCNPSDYKSE
jgi:hypothetical protein